MANDRLSLLKDNPQLYIKSMQGWQSKILNAVAWLIGIRGEDTWIITINKEFKKEHGIK